MQPAPALPKVIDRIGFVLSSENSINHFAKVMDELAARGAEFDIVEVKTPIKITPEQQARWKCGWHKVKDIKEQGQRYQCLVTYHPQVSSPPRHIRRMAIHNIRFMYAAGTLQYNMSHWNRLYTGVLSFGPFYAAKFKELFNLPTFEMGYPRFDQYFNDKPDIEALQKQFNCDPDKPTIVWLPSWKELSSVELFKDEVASLADRYNLIVKVHPFTPQSDPHIVDALNALPFNSVITDSGNNIHLYQMADYMLFDYGGPVFGAIYTGKKFVLLNVPGASENAWTGTDSTDVLLREVFSNVSAEDHGLAALLANDDHWAEHIEACKSQSAQHFAPYHGTSAARAAEALIDRSWLQQT